MSKTSFVRSGPEPKYISNDKSYKAFRKEFFLYNLCHAAHIGKLQLTTF